MSTHEKLPGAMASHQASQPPLDIYYYLYKCNHPVCTYDCREDSRASSLHRTAEDGYREAVHASCKRLECRSCAPRVVDLRIEKIQRAIEQYGLTTFVTLTYARVYPAKIKEQLKALIKGLRKKLGKDMQYLWVIGGHTQDHLHFHLLIDRPISKNQLRKTWMSCGGGQQVDVAAFPEKDSGNIAAYMIRNWLQSYHAAPVGRRMAYSRGMSLRFEKDRTDESNWEFKLEQSTGTILKAGGYSPHVMGTGGGVNPSSVFYGPTPRHQPPQSNTDASASEQTTEGEGVLCGSGAEGSTTVPATPHPVGAHTVPGEDPA